MNVFRIGVIAAALVAAAAGNALAHGGSYRGPPQGGPGSGAVPPGTADEPAPLTRWESWWASNKELYLRLHERMREPGEAAVTPGVSGEPGKSPQELRAEQDAEVRAGLVPVFVEALSDKSFEVRTSAAIALGKTGDPRGGEPLRKAAVDDKHKDVRNSAVLALGLLGRDENIPFLEQILSDPRQDTRNRSFAAFSLGMIGGEDATGLLLRFVDGRGPRRAGGKKAGPILEASAFVALGLTGRPEVLPTLRDNLDLRKHDKTVRAFIMLSLGRLKDREMLPRAIKMLRRDKDAGLRRSGAIAIGKMATAADEEAVKALEAAVHGDSDYVTKHFAAIALGGIADADGKARLEKMFRKGDSLDRPFLALALGLAKHEPAAPAIRKWIPREYHKTNRAGYCIALALLGDRESIPLIETEAESRGDPWLPGYAALALGMLGSRSSAPMLRKRLADENDPRLRMNLAVSLGLLHDARAREFLIETVENDGTIFERGSAAMAIGVLRLNEAVPNLRRLYENEKEQDLVRAFSVVALGVLADPSPIPKLARFSIDNNYSVGVDPLNEVLSIL